MLLRWLTGCLLVTVAVACVAADDRRVLVAALAAGFLFHCWFRGPLNRALLTSAPVVVSAAALYVLQLIAGTDTSWLPLKMLVVFFCSSATLGILPWAQLVSKFHPNSRGFHALLWAHFVRHFVHILGDETLRILRAWEWSSRGAEGRTRLRALSSVLSGLFLRSLTRAERFYAAQLVRGLAE